MEAFFLINISAIKRAIVFFPAVEKFFMKKFVNLFLILFLALFCCFAIVPTVFAEEGIKASPLRIEGLVEPGQTLVKFVKVTNVSKLPKSFMLI